jgi:hypothetical protein
VGAIRNWGIVAIASALVSAAPIVIGLAFAFRPSERWLALMRPLSLAAIFAAISNTMLGLVNTLLYVSSRPGPFSPNVLTAQLAETLAIPFVAFGCLTIAWLGVAAGMRKQL